MALEFDSLLPKRSHWGRSTPHLIHAHASSIHCFMCIANQQTNHLHILTYCLHNFTITICGWTWSWADTWSWPALHRRRSVCVCVCVWRHTRVKEKKATQWQVGFGWLSRKNERKRKTNKKDTNSLCEQLDLMPVCLGLPLGTLTPSLQRDFIYIYKNIYILAIKLHQKQRAELCVCEREMVWWQGFACC